MDANQKTSVMVVDDDPSIRALLTRTLEDDYTVITAENGDSALRLLDDISPELIILDYAMPGLNGMEVLGCIRERSDIPVIMMTARKELETICGALSFGADDFVMKPFGTMEFAARVKAVIRRARWEDEGCDDSR